VHFRKSPLTFGGTIISTFQGQTERQARNQQAQSDFVWHLLLAGLLTLKIYDYSFIVIANCISLTEISEKKAMLLCYFQ
jgi:hypothetical protein